MNSVRFMRYSLQNSIRHWREDVVEPIPCACAAAQRLPGIIRTLDDLLVALDTDENRLVMSELKALRERNACRTIIRQLEERNAALDAKVEEMKKWGTSEDPRFAHFEGGRP